jgi:hypothetical protein
MVMEQPELLSDHWPDAGACTAALPTELRDQVCGGGRHGD